MPALFVAIALPPSSHFIYIPVIFVIGIVLGFLLGAKATRDEIALGQTQGGRARGAAGGARRPAGRADRRSREVRACPGTRRCAREIARFPL